MVPRDLKSGFKPDPQGWRDKIDAAVPDAYKELAPDPVPALSHAPVRPGETDQVSFGDGGRRDAKTTAYTLMPLRGIRRVAITAKEGSVKYGNRNWEKGIPIENCLEHALDHIFLYIMGDRTEDHLGHAAWNLLAACDSEERFEAANKDLPPPLGKIGEPPEYVMKAFFEALDKAKKRG